MVLDEHAVEEPLVALEQAEEVKVLLGGVGEAAYDAHHALDLRVLREFTGRQQAQQVHLVALLLGEGHPFVVSPVAQELDAGDHPSHPGRDGRRVLVPVVRAVLLARPVGSLVGAGVPGDRARKRVPGVPRGGEISGTTSGGEAVGRARRDERGGDAVEESPAETVSEGHSRTKRSLLPVSIRVRRRRAVGRRGCGEWSLFSIHFSLTGLGILALFGRLWLSRRPNPGRFVISIRPWKISRRGESACRKPYAPQLGKTGSTCRSAADLAIR